jgi:hypothetical protein
LGNVTRNDQKFLYYFLGLFGNLFQVGHIL